MEATDSRKMETIDSRKMETIFDEIMNLGADWCIGHRREPVQVILPVTKYRALVREAGALVREAKALDRAQGRIPGAWGRPMVFNGMQVYSHSGQDIVFS